MWTFPGQGLNLHPPQRPEPLQRRHQMLSPLCHRGNSSGNLCHSQGLLSRSALLPEPQPSEHVFRVCLHQGHSFAETDTEDPARTFPASYRSVFLHQSALGFAWATSALCPGSAGSHGSLLCALRSAFSGRPCSWNPAGCIAFPGRLLSLRH